MNLSGNVVRDYMNFYKINDLSVLKEGDFHVLIPPALEEKRWKAQTGENICMIVPGLMFDKKGNRLGYGKGFYDRFIVFCHKKFLSFTYY